jgi:hypothetical protein
VGVGVGVDEGEVVGEDVMWVWVWPVWARVQGMGVRTCTYAVCVAG